MFSECSGQSADFVSSWEKKSSVQDSSTQTVPLVLGDNDCQIPEKYEAEVQTDAAEKQFIAEASYDPETLAAFLQKVAPLVCSVLERNRRSNAFSHYQLQADSESTSTQQLHSLNHQAFSLKFRCNDVSWNSTGSVLAVAYGAETHEDWCEHDCGVAVWNLQRKDFHPTKPNTVIETNCCVTSVAFHPEFPAVLAAGKFNGEILLWNIGQDDDMVLASTGTRNDSHREPITSLYWIRDSKRTNKFTLVSSSLDGKVLVWTFNEKFHMLDIADGYLLLAKNLPWSVRAKSTNPNAEVGVTCLSFNSEDSSIFIVGTEGGGVFLCSLNSEISANYSLATSVHFKSPLVMGFAHHHGYVSAIHFSPHTRNLFLTCGSDGELRVYNLLQSKPILSLQSLAGFQKAQWSPVRPLVIAAVSNDGHLQIYDLLVNKSVPVSNLIIQDKLCCSALQFNEKSVDLVATGCTNGEVQVWQLGSSFYAAEVKEKDVMQEMSTAIAD